MPSKPPRVSNPSAPVRPKRDLLGQGDAVTTAPAAILLMRTFSQSTQLP